MESKTNISSHCEPLFYEFNLLREFALFQQQKLSNLYVVPSDSSPLKWFGVLFVHNGIYRDAILRFELLIPECYFHLKEAEHPKIIFDTIPFHPLVNPKTGELNVKKEYPIWKPNTNHLWQILEYTKIVFYCADRYFDYKIDSNDPLKLHYSQLVKLFRNQNQEFIEKVTQSIKLCKEKIFSPKDAEDANSIVFSEYVSEIHDPIKEKLLHSKSSTVDLIHNSSDSEQSPCFSISWIENETLFSKPVL